MGPQGSRADVMAKDNEWPATAAGCKSLQRACSTTDIYKRSQGRIVRQVTCLAIWVAFALGAWRMIALHLQSVRRRCALDCAVPRRAAGGWACGLAFGSVNMPSFADFLIAVEAEMNKVSWPSRTELIRSSMVVIVADVRC